MKVLVTGTSGRVGSVTAREFIEHGYTVRVFDKQPPPDDIRQRAEVVYADLTDRFALLRAAEGCDAIAHLAAIPHPGNLDDVIFQTNVTGTQFVLAAAEAHGIKRVALASSCCAFGIFFARQPLDPQYLPLDEAHPAQPQDLYGLSKLINEQTAATYSRRTGMTTVCLRLTTVVNFDSHHPEWARWQRRRLENSDQWRAGDFWTYIETRDCARAFRLAIEKPIEGSHVLIVAARDSYTPHDIRDLMRQHYPNLAAAVERLGSRDSLYNTQAAENVLGFVAEHSWRDVAELKELDKTS